MKRAARFRDFILAQPLDMPAPEVVTRGKKAGLKFARQTVHTTRLRARDQQQETKKKKNAPTTALKDLKTRVRSGDDLDARPEFAFEPVPEPVPADPPTTGAAFVRSMPIDMPSDEVIAKGAEAGLTVSVATVHNQRSKLRRDKGKRGRASGASFVRTCPPEMSAADVVAAAAEAGITITPMVVYAARADIRKKAQKGPQQAPAAARSAARVSRASNGSQTVDASREAKRQQFKALILELGMDDAESIWTEFSYIRSGIRR